jgi:hypothetical protein
MLVAAPDAPGEIKGVTTLDTEAILRARSELSRPRSNRFLSFITGEMPVETDVPADPASFARPDGAVRREMLRLQIEAETADLQAESIALKADELARRGIHLSALGALPPGDAAEVRSEADGAGEHQDPPASETALPHSPVPGDDASQGDAAQAGDWPSELDPEAGPGRPSPG